MFGFGRSSNEKAVVNLFALQLQAIGLPEREAARQATDLVDEVLPNLRSRGIDPFKTTQGDEYIQREQFTAPRIAAGLTVQDIRSHWNRPLVAVVGEIKLRELIYFIVVDIARQQGKDIAEAGRTYKVNFPRYGDPRKWDPAEAFNQGLTEMDADLFEEFAGRVDAWQRRVGAASVRKAIESHGTLNAAVRAEIDKGSI